MKICHPNSLAINEQEPLNYHLKYEENYEKSIHQTNYSYFLWSYSHGLVRCWDHLWNIGQLNVFDSGNIYIYITKLISSLYFMWWACGTRRWTKNRDWVELSQIHILVESVKSTQSNRYEKCVHNYSNYNVLPIQSTRIYIYISLSIHLSIHPSSN